MNKFINGVIVIIVLWTCFIMGMLSEYYSDKYWVIVSILIGIIGMELGRHLKF